MFSGEGVGLTRVGEETGHRGIALNVFNILTDVDKVSLEPARALHLKCTLRKVDTWAHSNHNKNEQLSPKSCSVLVTLGSTWTVLPAFPELQTLSETETKTRTRMDAEHEP